MQSELKACRWCGEKKISLCADDDLIALKCWGCGARGPLATTANAAVIAWNARAEGDAEITQRIQAAIKSVDFKDIKSRILREYLKAGARRIIAAVNDALKTSTGEGK